MVGGVGFARRCDLIHENAPPPLVERAAASKIHFLRVPPGENFLAATVGPTDRALSNEPPIATPPHRLIRQPAAADYTLVIFREITGRMRCDFTGWRN